MRRVALAVTDGMSALELAGPCAVFGVDRSDVADPWYDFLVCGSPGTRVAQWFRLETSHGFDDLPDADTVIVPSQAPTVDEHHPPADLVEAVRAAHEGGARVVSICTGAFVLAAAGILNGRRTALHWSHTELFTARHPGVPVDPGALYADHGDVMTASCGAAGIDVSLHIVRTDHGEAAASAVAHDLAIPPRSGRETVDPPFPFIPGSPYQALAKLISWVDSNLDQPLTVADLARQANMSTRNLTRHFNTVTGTSPLQWLSMRRMQRARELLETSDESVEHIAKKLGLGSAATLRRHFNRVTGVPPDTYRRAFRAATRPAAAPPSTVLCS